MKERPILFSAPMVRALLAGTKTQTRREVKGQVPQWNESAEYREFCLRTIRCPYGPPGDRLWVRETWGTSAGWDGIKPSELPSILPNVPIRYAADGMKNDGRWRPSIFMLRWMSRITLELTAVRVERLNEISVEDALAEGIEHRSMNDPRVEYKHLWESINGAGSWAKNPWVWALTFKKL